MRHRTRTVFTALAMIGMTAAAALAAPPDRNEVVPKTIAVTQLALTAPAAMLAGTSLAFEVAPANFATGLKIGATRTQRIESDVSPQANIDRRTRRDAIEAACGTISHYMHSTTDSSERRTAHYVDKHIRRRAMSRRTPASYRRGTIAS